MRSFVKTEARTLGEGSREWYWSGSTAPALRSAVFRFQQPTKSRRTNGSYIENLYPFSSFTLFSVLFREAKNGAERTDSRKQEPGSARETPLRTRELISVLLISIPLI